MYSITNVTKGPRFLYSQGEPKLIEAGETATFDLTDSEIKNAQHQVDAKLLAWEGDAPSLPADGDLTAASLLAKVNDMPFLTFKSAATKILGPDAPTTKAEIVAALQVKADAESA